MIRGDLFKTREISLSFHSVISVGWKRERVGLLGVTGSLR